MSTFIIILVIFVSFITVASRVDVRSQRKFYDGYLKFLDQYNGHEFFCYTNRVKFCDVIESELIPRLDAHVHVIKMVNKEPHSELDKTYISYALYSLREIGFPNVMKIVNGRIIDLSLHKAIYDSINNKQVDTMLSLVNSKLVYLRELAKT